MTSMVVTMLRSGDLAEMAGPLTAAKLPIADLGEPGRTFFRFDDAQGLIGMVVWKEGEPIACFARSSSPIAEGAESAVP